jgi:hypothetical protein
MTSIIESNTILSTMPDNVPSLCIPRVFPNITEARIRKIFGELHMGDIERVDIVAKTTEQGQKFNRVFVHFRKWNKGGNAEVARERLLNGKDIKIVYDEPWFWKISAYKKPEAKRHAPATRQHKKPSIIFEDTDETYKKQYERKKRINVGANPEAKREQQAFVQTLQIDDDEESSQERSSQEGSSNHEEEEVAKIDFEF